jgi:hypothetical protein
MSESITRSALRIHEQLRRIDQDQRRPRVSCFSMWRRTARRSLLHHALRLLEVTETLYQVRPSAFAGIASFIGRTLLYSTSVDCGTSTFSLRFLAEQSAVARTLLRFRNMQSPTYPEFLDARDAIRGMMGVDGASAEASSLQQLLARRPHDALFRNLAKRVTNYPVRAYEPTISFKEWRSTPRAPQQTGACNPVMFRTSQCASGTAK